MKNKSHVCRDKKDCYWQTISNPIWKSTPRLGPSRTHQTTNCCSKTRRSASTNEAPEIHTSATTNEELWKLPSITIRHISWQRQESKRIATSPGSKKGPTHANGLLKPRLHKTFRLRITKLWRHSTRRRHPKQVSKWGAAKTVFLMCRSKAGLL